MTTPTARARHDPLVTLSGHSAVVFGGTKGIGAATAELLAERGASVAVVGRHEKEGEAVAARCRQLGAAAIFVEADVSSEPEVAAAVDAAVGAHGPLSMAIVSIGSEYIGAPQPSMTASSSVKWVPVSSFKVSRISACTGCAGSR